MDEYLGTIKAFGFNFAPRGWALCDGSILPIASNAALFALLGTNYGGNGQATFGLPDLRGRVAVGMGQGAGLSGYSMGQQGGTENVTLSTNQMPLHNHTLNAFADSGDTGNPSGALLANTGGLDPEYRTTAGSSGGAVMGAQAVGTAGGSQPHPNLQPFLVVNYCIALQGIFPSRN